MSKLVLRSKLLRRVATGTRAVVVLLGVVALAQVARAAGKDRVLLVEGKPQKGTVTKDNAEGVTLRFPGSGTADYSREQVVKVEYEGRPTEYDTGVNLFDSGNYENALRWLGQALERKHPSLLKQYILYYTAKSHQKLNEPAEAIPAFEGIAGQGGKSRFLYEAAESLIELYSEAGRIDDARRMLRGLPTPKTRGEKLKRLIFRAVIEENDGKLRRAMQIYGQAKRDAGHGDQEEWARAAVGVVRCMLGLNKHSQAAKDVAGLVNSGKLGDYYAEAYVILGDALMATAKTDEDYEAAILAYLRVPALYPGNEATEAKALLGAGQAYQRVTGNEDAKNRAAKLFRMLKQKYPNSSYAEQAGR